MINIAGYLESNLFLVTTRVVISVTRVDVSYNDQHEHFLYLDRVLTNYPLPYIVADPVNALITTYF